MTAHSELHVYIYHVKHVMVVLCLLIITALQVLFVVSLSAYCPHVAVDIVAVTNHLLLAGFSLGLVRQLLQSDSFIIITVSG